MLFWGREIPFSIIRTQFSTPFSGLKRRARSCAVRLISCELSISATFWTKISLLSFFKGIGLGEHPIWKDRWPQKCWSPIGKITGHERNGIPARRHSAMVPIPPWCITALTLGNNLSYGAASIILIAGIPCRRVVSSNPQPFTTSTLTACVLQYGQGKWLSIVSR